MTDGADRWYEGLNRKGAFGRLECGEPTRVAKKDEVIGIGGPARR